MFSIIEHIAFKTPAVFNFEFYIVKARYSVPTKCKTKIKYRLSRNSSRRWGKFIRFSNLYAFR